MNALEPGIEKEFFWSVVNEVKGVGGDLLRNQEEAST
jgi:hypothetical protein